jgi:hypothetical protein
VVAATAAAINRDLSPLQFAAEEPRLVEGQLADLEAVHQARDVFVAAFELFDAAEQCRRQVFPAWTFHWWLRPENPGEAYDGSGERRYLAASGKPEGSPDAAGSDQVFGLFSDM